MNSASHHSLSTRPSPAMDPQLAAAMRDYQRQRQMTLGDLLLENRIIFLQGEIYDGFNVFILERIAEEEDIEAEEGDFEKEIFLIAMQSGESPRRVRAQIEKRGLMDVLQNQILERKVLQAVQDQAKFKDQPYQPEPMDVEAIPLAAGGGEGTAAIHDATGEAEAETEETAEAEVS